MMLLKIVEFVFTFINVPLAANIVTCIGESSIGVVVDADAGVDVGSCGLSVNLHCSNNTLADGFAGLFCAVFRHSSNDRSIGDASYGMDPKSSSIIWKSIVVVSFSSFGASVVLRDFFFCIGVFKRLTF